MFCYDTTHGTTGYDFEQTSLLVSDKLDESTAVAYCISSTKTFYLQKSFSKKWEAIVDLLLQGGLWDTSHKFMMLLL